MKIPFISDRRGGDSRRENSRRKAEREDSDRRQSERRVEQRRTDIRLIYPATDSPQLIVYPPGAEPKIIKASLRSLTTDFRIADISKKAVRFICEISCDKCNNPLKLTENMAFTVQFHDEEIIDMTASLYRYFSDLNNNAGTFVTVLDVPLTQERIIKEQSYLLKHYPDFCRAEMIDKRSQEVANTTAE